MDPTELPAPLHPSSDAPSDHDVLNICRKSFCARDDILLCLAVNERKPWAAPTGEIMHFWADIADKLMHTRAFGLRKDGPACKTRFEKILKMITSGEGDVLRKSGTEDEFAERERLVLDICQQIERYRVTGEVARSSSVEPGDGDAQFDAKRKRKASKLLNVAKREKTTGSNPSSPLSKRYSSDELKALFEYLKKRMDLDDAREERRLEAERKQEERRAAAEERRMALELDRDKRMQDFMLNVLDVITKKMN
ncbi:hypothetical protein LEN26_018474 [Aphanomyces euteiches]|nr:hypothetical protein LEN26_018474 [Aphanomyces euteiches]KAH9125374.1 hypothetical protein AeMF1_003995 [Aphanomyces euteiches]KAH9187938.1 hypothetical protein AeNC1_010084 [Aphanomyces euteiches]